jgi:hypothetical protein
MKDEIVKLLIKCCHLSPCTVCVYDDRRSDQHPCLDCKVNYSNWEINEEFVEGIAEDIIEIVKKK